MHGDTLQALIDYLHEPRDVLFSDFDKVAFCEDYSARHGMPVSQVERSRLPAALRHGERIIAHLSILGHRPAELRENLRDLVLADARWRAQYRCIVASAVDRREELLGYTASTFTWDFKEIDRRLLDSGLTPIDTSYAPDLSLQRS